MRVLRIDERSPFRQIVGVGGLGTGIFFTLDGEHTLGRNESRSGRLLDVRDYCKLHIVLHYVAKLLENFSVIPVGKIGDDAAGTFVLREMRDVGMDTRFVEVVAGKPTLFSVCFQYPDGCGGNITTSNSAAGELGSTDIDRIEPVFGSLGPQSIALLVPEVSLEARRHFLKLAKRHGAFCAASFISGEITAAKEARMFDHLDLVSLNEEETSVLLGKAFSAGEPEVFVEKCVRLVGSRYPQLLVVMSAGKDGAYGISRGGWSHCPAPRVEVASSAGAGDCLLGGILAGLAAGIPLMSPERTSGVLGSALELGVLLAGYKVTSPHTIHPDASLDRVLDFAEGMGLDLGRKLKGFVAEEVTKSDVLR
jgi:sugar/nucleoside kinase (ribokinase family)